MKEHKTYMELVHLAVDQAIKQGADVAEAFVSNTQSVQINVSNRQAEQVNAYNEVGIGLRILKEQKLIFGSSNDLSKESLKILISDLLKKVKYHTVDEFNVIPEKDDNSLSKDWSTYSELLSYDPKIVEVPIQEKIQRAIRLETSALDFSPKVKSSLIVIYQDEISHIYLANSNGVSGWFPISNCGGAIYVSASDGQDHQSGTYQQVKVKYDDFDPQEVGHKAAENAVKMLGAKPIESCEIPMIVPPEVGTSLLSYIVSMLSADRVQKGKSLFADKLNTAVAAGIVNIIDDGKLHGGIRTAPVDGEGIPKQTTPLIVDGMLKNYLYDSYTAKKGKVKSTGNRARGGYNRIGMIDSSNLYLKEGNGKPAEIFSVIDKGFYIKDAIGLHGGIDATSGDFSIPVAGFMIEKGEISFPIRGISIGGNLFDLLKSIDKITNDLTWFGEVGAPTFSISNIKIGGSS